MIWPLIIFLFTMLVLRKLAFPPIQEALDKRAKAVAENIEASERQRKEADEVLQEYRARPQEGREGPEHIPPPSRKAGDTAKPEPTEEGRAKREELVSAAKRDI